METETQAPVNAPPVTWVRPKEGRRAGGVAAGVADALSVPRWLIRLGFVVLTLWSGAGILLYVAGWLLMPGEGESESIGRQWANRLNGSQSWVGLVLVVVAVAALIGTVPFFDGGLIVATALLVVGILLYRGDIPGINWKPRSNDPLKEGESVMTTPAIISDPTVSVTPPAVRKAQNPPSPLGQVTIGAAVASCGVLAVIDRFSTLIDAGPRHYLALVITIIGVGLLVGGFLGRARWLIVLGIFLIPAAVGTAVFELADGRIGTVDELARPTAFATLATSYNKGAGQLVIDLTQLPWDGQAVDLSAEVGAGELVLILPEGVSLEARGQVGIGEFDSPAGTHDGLGVDETITVEVEGERGTVNATLEVGVGTIRVESPFNGFKPLLPRGPGAVSASGNVIVDLTDQSGLEPFYSTTEGDIVLDLGSMDLVEDASVEVTSDSGDISVILPADASYRIEVLTDTGTIDLFGESTVENGGSVIADSVTEGTFTVAINIFTIEGDISLSQGARS